MFIKYLTILSLLLIVSCSTNKVTEAPEIYFEEPQIKEEVAKEEKIVKKIETAPIIKKAQDVVVAKKVFFDTNSSKISNSASQILAAQSLWLKNNPAIKNINVEGHCDERGSDKYNLALGEKRALAVKKYLIKHGVKSDRIKTISYGESKPINMGHDERAWSQNRRAVVITQE